MQFDQSIIGASEKAEKIFQEKYPAVYTHLLQYKSQLSARNKAETGIRYNGMQCSVGEPIIGRIHEVEDANIKTSMVEELHEKQKRILTMPSGNDMDENFRRLKYVQYADDFLIGVICTKAECETLNADITKFMQEKLKLEMSQEKTLITNAQKHAKFLGYEIFVRKDYATKKNSSGIVRRHFNGNVILHVSREVIKKKLLSLEAMKVITKNGKETWESRGRTYMIDNAEHEIVARFNTEIRGFYNYYSIANNASVLGRSFGCIIKFSMYKILAQKLNLSVRQVTNKYRKDILFAVPFTDKKGETKYRVFYNEGFARKTDCEPTKYDTPFCITLLGWVGYAKVDIISGIVLYYLIIVYNYVYIYIENMIIGTILNCQSCLS